MLFEPITCFLRGVPHLTHFEGKSNISAHSRIISGSSLAVSFLVQYPHTVQYWNPLKRSFSSFEWHSGHLFKKRGWSVSFLFSVVFFLSSSSIVKDSFGFLNTYCIYLLHHIYRFPSDRRISISVQLCITNIFNLNEFRILCSKCVDIFINNRS